MTSLADEPTSHLVRQFLQCNGIMALSAVIDRKVEELMEVSTPEKLNAEVTITAATYCMRFADLYDELRAELSRRNIDAEVIHMDLALAFDHAS